MAVFKKLIFIFKNKLFNGLFDRMPLNKDVVLVKYIILFHSAGVSGRCVHSAEIPLMLSIYIDENCYIVEKLSTSMPCSWNMVRNEKKLQSSFTTFNTNQVNDKSQMVYIGILDQKNLK